MLLECKQLFSDKENTFNGIEGSDLAWRLGHIFRMTGRYTCMPKCPFIHIWVQVEGWWGIEVSI